MAAGKQGRQTRQIHKAHYCPDCGGSATLVRVYPGGAMWGRCEKDHKNRKGTLILK